MEPQKMSETEPSTIISVSPDTIRENPIALRGVNKESEHYLGLVASMRNQGFLGTIMVRPTIDPETNEDYYELVDGLHRWNAAKDAGISEIKVEVKKFNKMECMTTQVMMNLHKIETRPVEFTHQLNRMISMQPNLTQNELAAQLGKSTTWITGRLSLLKLDDAIQSLVDEGKITLSNAIPLCKLPKEEQAAFIQAAMEQSPAQFAPVINKRVKEIREARKEGRDPNGPSFSPIAHFQKKADVESQMEVPNKIMELVAEAGITDPGEIIKMTLKWVLNVDPQSVAVQEAKWQERKDSQEAAKAKRKAEREAKKQAEAAETQAEVQEAHATQPVE